MRWILNFSELEITWKGFSNLPALGDCCVTSWENLGIPSISQLFASTTQHKCFSELLQTPSLYSLHILLFCTSWKVLCETRWLQDNTPQAICPRYVARQQLEALKKLGFTFESTFELEFLLLDSKTHCPMFPLDFMSRSSVLDYEKLFCNMSKGLSKGAGIRVETIQTEYSQGQIEITTRYCFM